jgi:SAM-dependent methyltransferase
MADLRNTYDDAAYADAYAKLEFPGTYYLAYRDLPAILADHVEGRRALDFGCGAGRSTRFLRRLGLEAVGVDISAEMIRQALALDPSGDYRLIAGVPDELSRGSFDLILSVFTFDNVPNERKADILMGLRRLLGPAGRIVILVSSPDIYTHEWASFSSRDYPENRAARPGDVVRCINTAIADARPADDVLCPDASYREAFAAAGLEVVAVRRPLAHGDEPIAWVNETRIAPWVIYVLRVTPPAAAG